MRIYSILFIIIYSVLFQCLDDDQDSTYYTFKNGLYLSISGNSSITLPDWIIYENAVAVCTLEVIDSGFFDTDYTNVGPASLYEYNIFYGDSLEIEDTIITNPAAVCYRYQDCDSIEFGFYLADTASVLKDGNLCNGLKYIFDIKR